MTRVPKIRESGEAVGQRARMFPPRGIARVVPEDDAIAHYNTQLLERFFKPLHP